MRRCLHCGAELNSSTAYFCRGHHRSHKAQLLAELAAGTITPEHMDQLRMFNWLPVVEEPVVEQVVEPVQPTRIRKTRTVGTDVPFRKFGVELECVCPTGADPSIIEEVVQAGYQMQHTGYTHTDTPHWKSLYDGSVRGGVNYESKEYVSPAFETEAGLDEVANVCKIIIDHGGVTNTTTGTHVHLDASDLSPQEIAKIVYLYGKLEYKLNQLLPEDRRSNYYCKSVKRFCKYVSLSGFEYFNSIEKLVRVLGTRYIKVNVEAYLRHGTIEFRQLNGTLDGELVKYWVMLMTRIVNYVKTGGDVEHTTGSLYRVLGCHQDEIDFWNRIKDSLVA